MCISMCQNLRLSFGRCSCKILIPELGRKACNGYYMTEKTLVSISKVAEQSVDIC